MATLFTVDFEEGDLSDFDSTSGTGLSAIAPGLVATVWCMAVNVSDVTNRYGQIASAGDENLVRAFFSIDINTLTMADADIFTALLVEDNSSNNAFRVELGYTTTDGFRVRPGIYTDSSTWSDGSWVDISANEHTIELEWFASTGADDGYINLWVDVYGERLGDEFGAADSSVTGVDNDTRLARVWKLGLVTGVDAGTSGIFWVDHLTANDDDTEIGHPGIRAFAGAEGAGQFSVGGRGGTMIKVTNTNNSGAGSLRTALTTSGPRIIVFETDGDITLASNIFVVDPYVSIFGQTAPGDGICIRDYTLYFRTHDVICQHIRSRPGDDSVANPDDLDAITVENLPSDASDTDNMAFNLIFDHCSFSWAIDENISFFNSAPTTNFIKNITVQWCMIYEALSNAGHLGGEHSMGLLFGAGSDTLSVKNISVHHNLFTHNNRRNPRASETTWIEIVNNLMHDCPNYVFETEDTVCDLNFIGNWIGSQSASYTCLIEPGIDTADPANYFAHQVYVADNDTGNYWVDDDWQVVGKGFGAGDAASGAFETAWKVNAAQHIANSKLLITSATIAYNVILGSAGCFPRDTSDERIVREVIALDTGLIDSQDDVGGWPTLASGSAGTDTDGDGMPDTFEDANDPPMDKTVVDDTDTGYWWGANKTFIECYAWDAQETKPLVVTVLE